MRKSGALPSPCVILVKSVDTQSACWHSAFILLHSSVLSLRNLTSTINIVNQPSLFLLANLLFLSHPITSGTHRLRSQMPSLSSRRSDSPKNQLSLISTCFPILIRDQDLVTLRLRSTRLMRCGRTASLAKLMCVMVSGSLVPERDG